MEGSGEANHTGDCDVPDRRFINCLHIPHASPLAQSRDMLVDLLAPIAIADVSVSGVAQPIAYDAPPRAHPFEDDCCITLAKLLLNRGSAAGPQWEVEFVGLASLVLEDSAKRRELLHSTKNIKLLLPHNAYHIPNHLRVLWATRDEGGAVVERKIEDLVGQIIRSLYFHLTRRLRWNHSLDPEGYCVCWECWMWHVARDYWLTTDRIHELV